MDRGKPSEQQSGRDLATEGPNAHRVVLNGLDNTEITSQSSTVSDVWEGELSHSGMRITFKELEYWVRNRSNKSEKLPILRCISGFYLPAEMSAVMGPSGSGIATLQPLVPCLFCSYFLSCFGISMALSFAAVIKRSLCSKGAAILDGIILNSVYNLHMAGSQVLQPCISGLLQQL